MRFQIKKETLASLNIEIPSELEGLDVCTDSRSLKPGEVFLPLKGEKFDGHDFIENIEEPESLGVIISSSCTVDTSRFQFTIVVDDTLNFLQSAATTYRRSLEETVFVGLTGSNGKTTTKEMLKNIFEVIVPGKVHSTLGNLNNHFGVPVTLLRTKPESKVAVIEMGTNAPGEIERLSQICEPDIGVITNIGHAHLEKLKDLDGVFEEKTALYRFVKNNSDKKHRFIKNSDDGKLAKISDGEEVLSVSKNSGDLIFKQLEDETLEVNLGGKFKTKLRKLSDPILMDLMLALGASYSVYPEQLSRVIENLDACIPTTKNRGEWITWKNNKVFLDAYNANPDSMKASLSGFFQKLDKNTKPILVLGDMYELGDNAEKLHKDITEELNKVPVKNFFFVGQHSNDYLSGLNDENKSRAKVFHNAESLKEYLNLNLSGDECLFVKGSRGVQLEKILEE
ncbi:MAG: UDP-N-acetylmuramoyl-tripeptide--D-alanyl-D-alanine ligase [Bacteriovoracaceae bacterium]